MNGKRELFINLMINAGGMATALAGTVSHAQLFCISDYSDANLLEAIDQVKVIYMLFPFTYTS